MNDNFERFQISQVALLIRNNKCLILEDAAKPGFWLLPGGRVDRNELGEAAFARELREEIGFEKFERFNVIGYDIWYTANKHAPICAILNFIRNDNDEIKLSAEHLQYKWISVEDLDDYSFVWPKAKEMIKKGFESLKNNYE
ncbi:NUDIX domain-containing protein [Patescibacteria group bacterium]|nr:NUDIX domain-containing protein [Patescibacteria group bacterium]